MADTILTILQQFCRRTGLPAPSTIFGATDTQVLQYAAIANEVLEDMQDRGYWQELEYEALFVTVATPSQGDIFTIAPNGFSYIINKTIFDRTLRLPVYGPLTPQEWQALKALPTTGPLYKYRLRGNQLLFDPTPEAGHSCAFEYMSNLVVFDGTSTYKTWFTADTDQPYIDPTTFLHGVRWKWKAEKGFDYAEDQRMYEEGLENSLARNATKKTINLASPGLNIRPGIFVPWGSWNIP